MPNTVALAAVLGLVLTAPTAAVNGLNSTLLLIMGILGVVALGACALGVIDRRNRLRAQPTDQSGRG